MITAGKLFTVKVAVDEQPAPNEYVIVVVPGVAPVTMPPVLIPATDGVPLVQLPPPTALVSNEVPVGQADKDPVMGPGEEFTVTTAVTVHPDALLKVIKVLPGVTPVTTPVVLPTVATVGEPLVHVPAEPVVNVVVLP